MPALREVGSVVLYIKTMDTKSLYPELDRPVELQKLLKKLRLSSEGDLEKQSAEQPGLYLEASRFRAQLLHERSVKLAKLEVLKAEKALRIRAKKFEKAKGERLTEKEIENRILVDPEIRKAKLKLERLFQLEEWAKGLVAAFQQRRDMIRTISDIRNAEIASEVRAVKEGMARETMRQVSERTRRSLRDKFGEDED